MASFFYIYSNLGSHRLLNSLYPTQASANIAAFVDTDLIANVGAVDIPDNVADGWVWDTTDDVWREFGFGDLTELNQRKSAARTYHNQLRNWRDQVDAEAPYQNPDHTSIADKFLAYAHWSGYLVFTNVNDTWTPAQQIAWAFMAIQGSADITTVTEFYDKAHDADAGESTGRGMHMDEP